MNDLKLEQITKRAAKVTRKMIAASRARIGDAKHNGDRSIPVDLPALKALVNAVEDRAALITEVRRLREPAPTGGDSEAV